MPPRMMGRPSASVIIVAYQRESATLPAEGMAPVLGL